MRWVEDDGGLKEVGRRGRDVVVLAEGLKGVETEVERVSMARGLDFGVGGDVQSLSCGM